jgi:alpha-D-ribose 1-methylphosphonate 5-triphosphate synthase subunit PhnG
MPKYIDPDNADRKTWMSLLAKAPEADLLQLWDAYAPKPEFQWLRGPEVGSVMVRGRMGGAGNRFNLGEMTVTRCSLTLADGTVGHGYVQGRSKAKAEAAATIDALMQGDASLDLRGQVLDPLSASMMAVKTRRAAKAAATKVEFFTLVRGED